MAKGAMNIDLVWGLRSRGLLPTLDADYEDPLVKLIVGKLHNLKHEMDCLDTELRLLYTSRDARKDCDG